MNFFQKKLQQIMHTKRLSQAEIADMAQVSQTTISKWLTKNSVPKVSSIEPLAKALGLTVGDLLGDFGNNEQLSEEDKRFISLPCETKKALLDYLDFATKHPELILRKRK